MDKHQRYSVEDTIKLKGTSKQTSTCNVGVEGCACQLIYECSAEKYVHRQIAHEVVCL